MNEHRTWALIDDFVGRHTRIAAAYPQNFGCMADFVIRKEVGIVGESLLGVGSRGGKGLVRVFVVGWGDGVVG